MYKRQVFYYVELQDLNLLLLKTSVECKDVAESMASYPVSYTHLDVYKRQDLHIPDWPLNQELKK